jgi:hypothetical protein
MSINNKELYISDVLFKSENNRLLPTANATVQPVALMRLGLFVPAIKKDKAAASSFSTIDATEELIGMEMVKAEGYTNIKITAPRLTIEVDFKVWAGIILAFSRYGLLSNKITLSFVEFAELCGYSSKEKTSALRNRIDASLSRLTSTKIEMRSKDGAFMTSLVNVAQYNIKKDTVELVSDQRLWELYQVDRQVLVRLYALRQLPNKGVAQALYTYLEALPKNPMPVSFERIRERLKLTSTVGRQNQLIKAAVAALIEIGYLDATVGKPPAGKKETLLFIRSRDATCGLKALSFEGIGDGAGEE